MANANAVRMLCLYRIKKGKEAEFLALLNKHWPALNAVGLVTPEPATVLQGYDKSGNPFFIEQFAWKDADAPRVAHETPEVMAVWEPMGALADGMDFIQVRPVQLAFHA
jgi:hypothetical protein